VEVRIGVNKDSGFRSTQVIEKGVTQENPSIEVAICHELIGGAKPLKKKKSGGMI
jgi:hypothetical protein